MRGLGLDIGDSKIGVALSDSMGILASPHTIIDRNDEARALAEIVDIVGQNQVEVIVAGLPRSMDGSIGKQVEKVTAFVDKLVQKTAVPVEFRDERLTTVSARRLMQDNRRKKSRKDTRDDAVAAALILQGYLEERQNVRE